MSFSYRALRSVAVATTFGALALACSAAPPSSAEAEPVESASDPLMIRFCTPTPDMPLPDAEWNGFTQLWPRDGIEIYDISPPWFTPMVNEHDVIGLNPVTREIVGRARVRDEDLSCFTFKHGVRSLYDTSPQERDGDSDPAPPDQRHDNELHAPTFTSCEITAYLALNGTPTKAPYPACPVFRLPGTLHF